MSLSRIIGLIATAGVAASLPAHAQAPAPAAPPPTTGTQPAPACDSNCIRANSDRAVQACSPRIEAEAPGDYEWLFRPYGSIFQEADTPEQPSSAVVKYRGDSIRFMSPQREWVRAIYECGFDAATQRVAYVRVRLGVMGKASAVPPMPGARPSAPAGQVKPRPPQPPRALQSQASPSAPQSTGVDMRRIREPSEVDVSQIPPGAKPPQPTAPAQPAPQQ